MLSLLHVCSLFPTLCGSFGSRPRKGNNNSNNTNNTVCYVLCAKRCNLRSYTEKQACIMCSAQSATYNVMNDNAFCYSPHSDTSKCEVRPRFQSIRSPTDLIQKQAPSCCVWSIGSMMQIDQCMKWNRSMESVKGNRGNGINGIGQRPIYAWSDATHFVTHARASAKA